MRSLRQVLAAVCAVLFVISAVLALLLVNLEAQAFSSTTYKQAFEEQHLYERMPGILATTLAAYVAESGGAVPFLQILTVEDWQSNIAQLLPPEDLKAMADQALDATFDYLNGRNNSIVIFVLPIKAQLAGEAGVRLMLQILQRQPACTSDQLTQMALGLFGGQIALCNPPPELLGLVQPLVQSQAQTITSILPNELTLISPALTGTPDDPRLKLNTARTAAKLSPLVALLLLLGIAIFAARSLVQWLTWWGWPLMFAGGISVLTGLFASPVLGAILEVLIRTQGSFLIPPVLAGPIAETASAVARQMLTPVMVQGVILGVLGLGMVVLGTLLANRAIPPQTTADMTQF